MSDVGPSRDLSSRYTAPRGRVVLMSVAAALLAALAVALPARALLGVAAGPVIFAVGALAGGAANRYFRPAARREPVVWLIVTALGSAVVYAWLRQALG